MATTDAVLNESALTGQYARPEERLLARDQKGYPSRPTENGRSRYAVTACMLSSSNRSAAPGPPGTAPGVSSQGMNVRCTEAHPARVTEAGTLT